LKGAYIIQCDAVQKDAEGRVTELHCTYFPESRSGSDTSGLKAKGVLHWVSVAHAVDGEVRLYDKLFTDPEPTNHEGRDYLEFFNPDSLKVISQAKLEPSLAQAKAGEGFQFLRMGYFCADEDSSQEHPVFNLTVGLKDSK
jgi:glutaminyl-tRNA synthetase